MSGRGPHRRTGHKLKYIQYEGLCPVRRVHALDRPWPASYLRRPAMDHRPTPSRTPPSHTGVDPGGTNGGGERTCESAGFVSWPWLRRRPAR
jgi:hypothetical protein